MQISTSQEVQQHLSKQLASRLQNEVVHLGSRYQTHACQPDYACSAEVTARISAANKAWTSFWNVWVRRDLPLRVKSYLFQAYVLSVLLAGTEALVLT